MSLATHSRRSASRTLAVIALLVVDLSSCSLPAAASSSSDTELGHCLRKGKIVGNRLIGTGVTRPYRLELECDGKKVAAAFKTLDEERKGLTKFENASQELREITNRSISRALAKAVIARASLIVEKIDQDREAYGDEAVFKTLPGSGRD